jgi:YbgC/YbaW family acyl-CoA thioester hydrolase
MERIKVALPETFSFSTIVKIRITDLNYGGHVGNDSFLSLVHEARQQFLNSFGYAELNVEGVGLIMIDAVIEYKTQLDYGDEVRISVTITGLNRSGFDLHYLLEVNKEDVWTVAGKVKTGMLCYDYSAKKIVAVPQQALFKLQKQEI